MDQSTLACHSVCVLFFTPLYFNFNVKLYCFSNYCVFQHQYIFESITISVFITSCILQRSTEYSLSTCTKRRGTICLCVQIDGVLFVHMCKTTEYYFPANAKMTGYYFAGVLFVCDSKKTILGWYMICHVCFTCRVNFTTTIMFTLELVTKCDECPCLYTGPLILNETHYNKLCFMQHLELGKAL